MAKAWVVGLVVASLIVIAVSVLGGVREGVNGGTTLVRTYARAFRSKWLKKGAQIPTVLSTGTPSE